MTFQFQDKCHINETKTLKDIVDYKRHFFFNKININKINTIQQKLHLKEIRKLKDLFVFPNYLFFSVFFINLIQDVNLVFISVSFVY